MLLDICSILEAYCKTMDTTRNLTNLDFLEGFTNGENEKKKRYIEMYLKSTPATIRDFQNELNESNFENLRLKVHSIKPQAKYFGIVSLENILVEIESIISNKGDFSKLQPLITRATQISEKVEAELNSIIST